MREQFAVWAPMAHTMQLRINGETHSMTAGDDGWWTPPEDVAVEGEDVDYGYLLDRAEPVLPDPRSRRQPDGVHGLSRTDDPSSHSWQDNGWSPPALGEGVIYELHIGTFTPEGTLDAAAEKLDYLANLGVDFVELLPVNAFNGTHNWGYDGVLWYAVQETYGGPEAYRRFVDAAHRHGIGVIQDVVYNHLGPSGNYLPRFGPYLTEGKANTWGDSLNLDGPGSDEVRRYIIDNALMWFRDFHVDGLRLDAVHALHDERAVHVLEELGSATDECAEELGKNLILIAESDLNNPRLIESRDVNGYGLAGQWSDDFHHAVHVNLTGETEGYYADFDSVGALAKVLTQGFFHNGTYSSFRERHHGRPIDAERVQPHQLVVCTQNHDQIGNRAAGDRLTGSLNQGQLAIAAVVNILSPSTPMLFMGEEFGASTPWQFFTSHPEPELGTATAEGRLAEFERMGWDPEQVPNPQEESTFLNSKLDWSEAEATGHTDLLKLYRELIALRKELSHEGQLSFADVAVDCSENERWLIMRRGEATIVLNLGDTTRELDVGNGQIRLATNQGTVLDGAGKLNLPAHSAAVVL
ncbi:malto-oligosyltrehalose trehalohydrolase [Arthrobacter roseus]|uniref:malto-oligosyltrehalose trehalohydrolase n=1 Tax=Arthrobacter roseus TaxID=136274 RepID=UPI001966C4BF|nr:malto-oligosyltrehalose trehalohydrolase [Arthrobacter roseus]MBM7849273.1 maltooligosyltrehalose trehalohydrolase [Arthrobacter roseus]